MCAQQHGRVFNAQQTAPFQKETVQERRTPKGGPAQAAVPRAKMAPLATPGSTLPP